MARHKTISVSARLAIARIGEALYAWRQIQELNQHDAAKRIGISRSTLMDIEHGGCGCPRIETLQKIHAAIDIPMNEYYAVAAEARGK